MLFSTLVFAAWHLPVTILRRCISLLRLGPPVVLAALRRSWHLVPGCCLVAGQGDYEGGPLARRADHADGTAVQVNDPFAKRKSKSVSLLRV